MDRHHTNVSIAYAVIAISGAFAAGDPGRIAVGVLSRAPGDGAPGIAREIATAIGMTVLDIRTPQIEYHTGAMSYGFGVPFEQAVATGKPVLVILDEAQGAEPCVIQALMGILEKRVEDRPVAVIAITTAAGEREVATQMADGLGWDVDRIAMHRTDEENRRLAESMLAKSEFWEAPCA